MPDMTIECRENKKGRCLTPGGIFMFSVGEQEFYDSKGFSDPVRCKPCRDRKKQEDEARKGQQGGGNSSPRYEEDESGGNNGRRRRR